MGRNLVDLPEAESTQTLAEQLLPAHPPEGTTVLARNQTRGRGQVGNSWMTAPGLNLTFSVVLYPRFISASRVFDLNRWASLAVADTLGEWIPEDRIKVKWPNDVLVGSQKICGMIFHNQLEGGFLRTSIVGIGLNVNQRDFGALATKATSIALETGIELDLDLVLARLMSHLEKGYLVLKAGKLAAFENRYLQRLHGYQEQLHFRIGGEPMDATLAGVDATGKLVLEWGGKLHPYDLKQVEFIL